MNKCFYCECAVLPSSVALFSPVMRSRDHIQPKSKGGTNDKNNIVTACMRCNQLKGNMNILEFEQFLRHFANECRLIRKGLSVEIIKRMARNASRLQNAIAFNRQKQQKEQPNSSTTA